MYVSTNATSGQAVEVRLVQLCCMVATRSKVKATFGKFLAVSALFALLCSTLEANKNAASQRNVKQAVVKVSAEAECVYNVHVHVMCRHARMAFYVFV